MKKIIIAIDGHSSTGKSTLAKQLAQKLNYIYVDTGAMYRAITYFAMKENLLSPTHFDQEKLIRSLENIDIEFKITPQNDQAAVFLNNENVESKIRSMDVSNLVSKVAKLPEVRKKLVHIQQKMGQQKGIVMDGRDIGTVVFPKAELKLFMTASAKIRAERRYQEIKQKDDSITFEEVLKNVEERDQIDSSRQHSPLKQADDAIKIDNSKLNQKEQFEVVMKLVNKKLAAAD
ncbi:MAG: (d)CMP kinase [Bacteroidota bacterium]